MADAIDIELADLSKQGKLWWHGTSSWHLDKIKNTGKLMAQTECRGWDTCKLGVYIAREPALSASMWARAAKQAAALLLAQETIDGKGYRDGIFNDEGYLARNLAEKKEDRITKEEHKANRRKHGEIERSITKVLLTVNEDAVPWGECEVEEDVGYNAQILSGCAVPVGYVCDLQFLQYDLKKKEGHPRTKVEPMFEDDPVSILGREKRKADPEGDYDQTMEAAALEL